MKKTIFLSLVACFLFAQITVAQGSDDDFLTAEDIENIDLQIFTFTTEPRNSDFSLAGESFFVEGDLIAEHLYDGGKSRYYAIQRAEQNDILLTYLSLNAAGEALSLTLVYISEEQSKDLDFGGLTTDEMLDININYDPFRCETTSQDSAEKVESNLNGILIRDFKTKKDIEDFKQFLKRN
jgi:hypothetical protein